MKKDEQDKAWYEGKNLIFPDLIYVDVIMLL